MIIPIILRFRYIVLFSLIIIAFSIFIINRDSKLKSEYSKITSTLIYLDDTYGELPNRNFGKYRYLAVENYPYIFELFIGKESSDFSPKFEKIDSLKLGDVITIYGYESSDIDKEGVNRNIQFIEKNDQLFFERGDATKIVGISLIIISIILVVLCFIFMKMGKLKY